VHIVFNCFFFVFFTYTFRFFTSYTEKKKQGGLKTVSRYNLLETFLGHPVLVKYRGFGHKGLQKTTWMTAHRGQGNQGQFCFRLFKSVTFKSWIDVQCAVHLRTKYVLNCTLLFFTKTFLTKWV